MTEADIKLLRDIVFAVQEYSGGAYHVEEDMVEEFIQRMQALTEKAWMYDDLCR